ncbi:MAG: hypothetical protein WC997_11905 [Porticoccaceae bacterium]
MKLTDLDETLMHQTSLPFALAATSDHRFYDRYYISMFAPDGSAAIINGVGVYKNMNVMDGFVSTLVGNTQRNRRFSRPLHPDLPGVTINLGPIRVEIIKPYESLRYVVEAGGEEDGFDVMFTAGFPPHLEHPHTSRTHGRLHTDYLRQSQFGHMNGTARIAGKEIAVQDWFVWRDHSWGVRPGVGGFEPGASGKGLASAARAGGLGMLMVFFSFQTATISCNVQLQENEHGQAYYTDGAVVQKDGTLSHIVAVEHEVVFHPGSRLFKTAHVKMTTEDGSVYDMHAEAMGSSWVMRGAGYDAGYADGKGHGALRSTGPLHRETDSYDLSEKDRVRMPDGEWAQPSHREQIARITVNGEAGLAHAGIIVSGRNARYGFEA